MAFRFWSGPVKFYFEPPKLWWMKLISNTYYKSNSKTIGWMLMLLAKIKYMDTIFSTVLPLRIYILNFYIFLTYFFFFKSCATNRLTTYVWTTLNGAFSFDEGRRPEIDPFWTEFSISTELHVWNIQLYREAGMKRSTNGWSWTSPRLPQGFVTKHKFNADTTEWKLKAEF